MRKKIITAIILSVLLVSISVGVVSYISVSNTIEVSLSKRFALARTIANYVEVIINNNFNRLYDVSLSYKVDLKDGNWEPETKLLESAYRYSLFTEGVFLLDKEGREILSFPQRIGYFSDISYISYVNHVFRTGRPIISNVFTISKINKKVIFIMTPLKDINGKIIGIVGGILSPADQLINKLLVSAKLDENTYIEIIDSNEMVVASSSPDRVLEHHDHENSLARMIKEAREGIIECRHGYSSRKKDYKPLDLLVFVPFKFAPWGVVVGQPAKDIYSPAYDLVRTLTILVIVSIVLSLILSVAITRNIINPLSSLTASAIRIAEGDLDTPVQRVGSDEIFLLSKSFDEMRDRLARSLESIKEQNVELENRVALRTQQIRDSRLKIQTLLKKIMYSQEEERLRIARDLHDTILQDISAFLIKLDVCRMQPEKINVEQIDNMRNVAVKIIDTLHTVIKDLRPSVIDDLGLEAATVSMLEKRLNEKGINFFLDIKRPIQSRLPADMEIALYRIIQECIINIERHSQAQNVFVVIDAKADSIDIIIEDDGVGFDLSELMSYPVKDGRGLGIIGMKERAALINGQVNILSKPGEGTRICINAPLTKEDEVVKDKGIDS